MPARQAVADKPLAKENGPDSRYEVSTSIPLENVTRTASFKGRLDDIESIQHAQE